ncbi:MAG: hypothetical protein OEZ02_11995, partial [Anaerolineae bacterium]|nr:hypothetical protein [Anaerolineae bacterium]
VEAAKALSREMVTNYAQTGHLPHNQASSPSPHRLTAFLEHLQPHSFIAIQAYLNPDAPTSAALHTLVNLLHHKYNVIVTVGYGPRYLHSTGQLHKGDRGQGFFIQLISHPTQDIPIPIHPGKPDSEITFGILMQAQAHGDAAALANSGRQVLSFILGANPLKELEQLIQFLK